MTKTISRHQITPMLTTINMGAAIRKVEYLVIHFVGAPGQARDNGKYFKSTYREASAHYFVDPNEIVQVVPDNRQAWHVGDGFGNYGIDNGNSIGIEMCQDVTTGTNVWNWDFHPETRKQTILLVAELMKKYNVPIEKVVRHYDASRKLCPGNWAEKNKNGSYSWPKWDMFKHDLSEFVNNGVLLDTQRGINYTDGGVKVEPVKVDPTPVSKLDIATIAGQVLKGRWGNGDARKKALTKAGYDYDAVQKKVQELKKGTTQSYVGSNTTGGVYQFTTDVLVRSTPQVSDTNHTGFMYTKGDTVSVYNVISRYGNDWGVYTSWSGHTRYVNLGISGTNTRYAKKL